MKRQWRVLAALDELCREHLQKESFSGHQVIGFTAEEVAQASACSRSNASSDLNALHRAGDVVKIISRATYYLPVKWLEELFPETRGRLPQAMRHHREILQILNDKERQEGKCLLQDNDDVFSALIGHQGSLKSVVEQAKAAVLYPPRGLDALLVGPTGVGKTLFAERMFRFAAAQGKITGHAEMTVFNCADYAANPQLLLSQLFGHAKGAFTGAEREKSGLVESADGGMLFLDEVHRLPPEGQEMLFYLLDRGEFRRLGEVGQMRSARVRIVAATTEDPDSALLQTFLRRIPVVLHLPKLAQRPLDERLELIRYLLAREAVHIQGGISVSQEALWAMLLYRCPGNVGQLRNDLQLVCAKAFLYKKNESEVRITYEALPLKVKQGIVYDQQKRLETNRLLCQLGGSLQIRPDGQAVELESDRRLPQDFYHTIAERMRFLKLQGIEQEEIIQCVEMEVDNYFKRLSPQETDLSPDRLRTMLPDDFLRVFDEACNKIQQVGWEISRQLYYALAVHTAATVERLRSDLPIINPRAASIRRQYPEAYKVALKLGAMIGEGMKVVVPEAEICFITLMLATFEQRQSGRAGRVGVLVIAHGDSTASSMADFANRLLGVQHARSIDMPLEADSAKVTERAALLVQELDEGKGVILLVDMGSLSGLAQKLSGQTGVIVKGVEMVTTLMVLHVLHKAILPQYDLNSVYRAAWDVRSMLQFAHKEPELSTGTKDRAILTTCFTGQGAAAKMKKMLEKLMQQWCVNDVRIIALEAGTHELLQSRLQQLLQSYEIVASVGSVDPQLEGKPHLGLEEVIKDGAAAELRQIIAGAETGASPGTVKEKMDWEMLQLVVIDMLDEFLTFVNPRKVVESLAETLRMLEDGMEFRFSSSGMIRMLVHCGCMVERLLTATPIGYPELMSFKKENLREYEIIKTALAPLEKQFCLEVAETEICHLIEISNLERKKFRASEWV